MNALLLAWLITTAGILFATYFLVPRRLAGMTAALMMLLGPIAAESRAGWGGGSCGPVGPSAMQSSTGWVSGTDADGQSVLLWFEQGTLKAGWNAAAKQYRTYDASMNSWSEPKPIPWATRAPCKEGCPCGECKEGCECQTTRACSDGCSCVAQGDKLPTGVMQEKLSADELTWRGSKAAIGLEREDVPNLSAQPYVTVISADQAKREGIAAQIRNSELGKKVRVLSRDPSSWQLEGHKLAQDTAFRQSGLVIYVQAPPDKPGGFGRVLGEPQYVFESLDSWSRKIDPNFQPHRPAPAGGDFDSSWLLIGGVALAFVWVALPQPQSEGDHA